MANLELKTASGGSVTLVPEDGVSNVTATVKHESGVLASEQFALDNDLGVGQTWQNVGPSRALGVTYTNNTGKPICVAIIFFMDAVSGSAARIIVDGSLEIVGGPFGQLFSGTAFALVPNGSTYTAVGTGLQNWHELR